MSVWVVVWNCGPQFGREGHKQMKRRRYVNHLSAAATVTAGHDQPNSNSSPQISPAYSSHSVLHPSLSCSRNPQPHSSDKPCRPSSQVQLVLECSTSWLSCTFARSLQIYCRLQVRGLLCHVSLMDSWTVSRWLKKELLKYITCQATTSD